MTSHAKRLIRELSLELLHDREDKTVLRPVLLAMLNTAVQDFEKFFDRRHAANRVRDFDILAARNKAAKREANSMSRVWLRQSDGQWEVWTALNEDSDHTTSEAFIIGLGKTKAEAAIDALDDMAGSISELLDHIVINEGITHGEDDAPAVQDGKGLSQAGTDSGGRPERRRGRARRP